MNEKNLSSPKTELMQKKVAKGARYSTFKESSTRKSWTTSKMVQRLASNWLLECCCGSCYKGQKTASRSKSNDANEMNRKEKTESIELQISPIDSAKLENDSRLTLEKIPLTKCEYEILKDDEFLQTSNVNSEVSLANRKDDILIDTSDSKSKFSFGSGTLSNGMKCVIGSLPILPKKEKKSSSVIDEKKASQSDSKLEFPANIFAKCSTQYGQQKVSAMNIPELIIS